MKRSRVVRLTLAASASSVAVGALVACGGSQTDAMRCVERGTDRVVPDSLCGPPQTVASGSGNAATARSGYGGGGFSPFLWYFGGRMSRGFMTAGGYAPLSGGRYRSSSGYAIGRSRGIFGGGMRSSSPGVSAPRGPVSRGGFGRIGAGRFGGG